MDQFVLTKIYPGKFECKYIYNSQPLDLPVKTAKGTYMT